MRKKVFSALLFGTLAVVSTGSLVSCKDYDDDITNLQNQINELNTLVKTIQGQIEKGAILTAVTPTANGVTVELSNGKTYDITNGQKGDAGVDGTVWKIGDNGNWWSSTAGAAFVDTGMAAQGAKGDKGDTGAAGAAGAAGATGATGAAGKDGKYYVPNEQTGTFWVYNDGDKAAYDSKISYVAAATVSAVWEKDKLTINNVEGATDKKVVINLTTELKSLVFSPDFYYGGIEALDVASFKYKPLKLDKVDANADNAADAPTAAADFFTYAPELNATYFLNPSNAKIDVEKLENYKFIPYDKEYSRAIASTDFAVTKAEKKDGQVTVYASYNGEEIKKLSDNKVTVIALQYKGDDNVVTSDFAALRNTNWEKLALNNPKCGVNGHIVGDDHLYTTAAAAIAAAATVEVGWDKAIDLREYVNTDRVKEGSTECKAWDKNAAAGTVDKIGFKYVFELVGYKAGDNDTKQSVHAAIADDGYTLRPQMPKDGVQQAYGANQSKATIDKEPLVRVSLVDTKNKNQVVAVGYMKLKIVLTPVADVKPEALDMGEQDKAYTLTCGTAAYLTQKLNWHEVEEKIIAKINVSKADFHNNYVLKGATVNATGDEFVDADQFSSTDGTAIGTKIGVVSQTKTDENGTETEVLTWTVANNEAYSAFKAGKKELSTLVCYENKNNAKDRVYLKFSWKPEAINIKPETSFSNDNKIKSYWYAANDPVAGTGWNEIHGNVEVVGTTNNAAVNGATTPLADDEFVFNIKNTLVGNKLTVAKFAAPYQGLDTQVTTTFEFVNGHGLYANATGDKLYADALLTSTKLVATLDKVTGVVKLNADVTTNKEAKKLLNAYGHTTKAELEKSLTARVKVVAKVCTNINVPVSTNEFDVKFIRPISVTSASATFTDAAETEKALSLTFKDWRNMGFTDASRIPSGANFFAYYGVKIITLDTTNATTDLNGNAADKLKDVAPKIKLGYKAPAGNGSQIVDGDYGKITYENLGNTVGTFHIVIPGTVTYHWGELPIKVQVTVNGTVSAKRH